MSWGRAYFAIQAIAGAAWWAAVFVFPPVRGATLGSLDPVVIAILDIPLFVAGSALAAAGLKAAGVATTAWTVIVTFALGGYATMTGEAGWGVLLMSVSAGGSLLALSLTLIGRVPTEWIIAGPFGFRPADVRARPAVHLMLTAVEIVIFWGLFLGVIPLVVSVLEQRWGLGIPFPASARPVGVVVLVLASALGLWSAAVMSRIGRGTPLPAAMPNHLVIAGPYRVVRNPMALASIAQGVAVAMLLSSWLVVLYAVSGALLWNYAVRPHEERDLEARFGAEFRRYRAAVRCWWPRLRPYVPVPAGDDGQYALGG